MKEALAKIRKPKTLKTGTAIFGVLMTVVLGCGLALLGQWLDSIGFDRIVTWKHILERLSFAGFLANYPIWLLFALALAVHSFKPWQALLNVFGMFAGLCGFCLLGNRIFTGFDASPYMNTLYLITAIVSLLAPVLWYARGKGAAALILNILIMAVFWLSCFGIGWISFEYKGILYLLTFLGAIVVLYRDWKVTLGSAAGGLVLAFLASTVWPL